MFAEPPCQPKLLSKYPSDARRRIPSRDISEQLLPMRVTNGDMKYKHQPYAFEDTGVRAYKGQADRLMAMADKPYLQVALQIHSIEARHASISRRILGAIRNKPAIKGWITNDEGSPALFIRENFRSPPFCRAASKL